MGQYKTEAIVLGVKNWGDADKIVTLFSKDDGWIRAAAYGSRRPKSPLAGGLQMFNRLEVQLSEGQRIDTVRSCSLLRSCRIISADLTAMAYGAFLAEIVPEIFPEKVPQPEVFDLLVDVLSVFESKSPRLIALAAGYQLLAQAGFQLQLTHCVHGGEELGGDSLISIEAGGVLCREHVGEGLGDVQSLPKSTREFLLMLEQLDWHNPGSFTVKKQDLLLAEKILLDDLHHVIGHPLKSLSFINQLPAQH